MIEAYRILSVEDLQKIITDVTKETKKNSKQNNTKVKKDSPKK